MSSPTYRQDNNNRALSVEQAVQDNQQLNAVISLSPGMIRDSMDSAVVPLLVNISPNNSEQQSAVTRRSFIAYTPHGDEQNVFKYYCPLCMQYYKIIAKTKCCGNSLCKHCIREYCATKRVTMDLGADLVEMESRLMASNSINCPHCQLQGFHIAYVGVDDVVRDYTYTIPPVMVGNGLEYELLQHSPIRIGESFDGLKRKMIKFRSSNSGTAMSLLAAESNQSEEVNPIGLLGGYDRTVSDRLVTLDANTPRIEDIHAVAIIDARFEIIRDNVVSIVEDGTDSMAAEPSVYYEGEVNDTDDAALLSPSIYSSSSDMLSPLNSSYQTSAPHSPAVVNLSSTMLERNSLVSSSAISMNLENYHHGQGLSHLYASLVVQQLLSDAVAGNRNSSE